MATQLPQQKSLAQTQLSYQAEGKPGLLSRVRHWVSTGFAGLFYLFLYAPIILLVFYSFNVSRFPTYWAGFTLDWYVKLFGNHLIGSALKNTLIVSITSTVIATIIGTMVSVAIERYRFRTKPAVNAMLFLPIIIPDIAMAYLFSV